MAADGLAHSGTRRTLGLQRGLGQGLVNAFKQFHAFLDHFLAESYLLTEVCFPGVDDPQIIKVENFSFGQHTKAIRI